MNVLRKLRAIFSRRKLDAEMAEEMRVHVEMQTERNLKAGLPPDEARYAALRQFGNVASLQQQAREARDWLWLEQLAQDSRYAVRMLMRNRVFTFGAVLTLALGIGANTAIFTLVNAVLLRSLPVEDPASLAIVRRGGKDASADGLTYHTSWPMYEALQEGNHSLRGLMSFTPVHLRVRMAEGLEGVSGQLVSANFFSVLGVKMAMGRAFGPEDEAAPAVVVISHRFWQRRMAGDPAVVGRTLTVGAQTLSVIGVTAPGFEGLTPGQPADLTVLMATQPWLLPEQGNLRTLGNAPKDDPGSTWPLFLVGRLQPGVSRSSAEAELGLLLRQWAGARGIADSRIEGGFYRTTLDPGGQGLGGLRERYARSLWLLLAVVACVFLIACANLAGLLLARTAARRRELAVRLAIGAGRGRVIRQLLTESLILTGLGGLAGGLLGWWGTSVVRAFVASGRTGVELPADPDWRVFAVTVLLAGFAGVGAGLVPARRGAAAGLPGLGECGQRRGRWSQALVSVQLALALCLLVATGLFASSLRRIGAVDPGFQTRNLLLVEFDWAGAGFDAARRLDFGNRAIQRMRETPGVNAASATFLLPLGTEQSFTRVSARGPAAGNASGSAVERSIIWPEYFRTLGQPLLRGREFDAHDDATAPRVAVINEALARFLFGDADPIGQPVWLSRDQTGTPATVVGVARDSTQRDLREPPPRLIYLPSTQTGHGSREPALLVRVAEDQPAAPALLRQALAGVSPEISVKEIATPQMQINRGLLQERLLAALTGFFGPLALLLAAVGLYGLLACQVEQRTREIGVRMALGATRSGVVRLVMRRGLALAGAGVLLGGAGALGLTRLVRSLLFATSPVDPGIFALAAGVLLLAAVIACWLPARRAAKVDPMIALRAE